MHATLLAAVSAALLCLAAAGCGPREPAAIRAAKQRAAEADEVEQMYAMASQLLLPYVRVESTGGVPGERDLTEDVQYGVELLEEILRREPTHWSAAWLLGRTLQHQGRLAEACDSLEKAYRLKRSDADVAHDYAYICLALGRAERGLEAARQAANLEPDNHGAKTNVAVALLLAGQVGKAEQAVQAALTRAPDDPVAKHIAGRIQAVKQGKLAPPATLFDLH